MSILEVSAVIVAVAGGCAGLVYLAGKARSAFLAIEAILHLVQRELEHNHGSSMKDDTVGMAVAIGKLQRDFTGQQRRLNRALKLAAKHHPEDAWLYLDPDERNPT